jgi:putative membrane protein
MSMFNGYGMGTGGWLLMGVFWIVLLALVVFAVVRLFSSRAEHDREARGGSEEPRRILDRRLASGEITVETYEQLSAKLDPASLARS